MDEKEFVSFETAKKLKEAGYGKKCCSVWHFDGEKANLIEDYPATFHGESNDFNNSDIFGLYVYSAPMLWQAQKWLRIRGVEVVVEPRFSDYRLIGYDWHIFDDCSGDYSLRAPLPFAGTYEAALSAGIDAALDFITNKTE